MNQESARVQIVVRGVIIETVQATELNEIVEIRHVRNIPVAGSESKITERILRYIPFGNFRGVHLRGV